MTRRDIRIRKDLFRKGQIERFKDFRKFEQQYTVRRRSERSRALMIAVAVIILLGALLFGSFANTISAPTGHPERNFEIKTNPL